MLVGGKSGVLQKCFVTGLVQVSITGLKANTTRLDTDGTCIALGELMCPTRSDDDVAT